MDPTEEKINEIPLVKAYNELHAKADALPLLSEENRAQYKQEMEEIVALMRKHERKDGVWDFSRERERDVFTQDDTLILRPLTVLDGDFYADIRMQYSAYYRAEISTGSHRKESLYVWAIFMLRQFYCVIEKAEDRTPIGFIGIKDSTKDVWEIAIELDQHYVGQGYGPHSVRLFLNEISRITGKTDFQAKVDADNVPSQKCFQKLGKLVGICPAGFPMTPEKEERVIRLFHDSIDDHIRELAASLGVEPEQLLVKVLDYRMKCPL